MSYVYIILGLILSGVIGYRFDKIIALIRRIKG